MSQIIIDGPPANESLIAPILAAREALSSQKTKQLSANHFGWCPYDDIVLMGPMGLEKHVAYDHNGEFATVLKRSQLLVFQNVDIRKLSDRDNNIPNGPPPQMIDVVKYAATCAGEIQDGYGEWGFMLLMSLVGMEPSEAFGIFKVIQPAAFKLSTLEDELIYEAPKRIEAAREANPNFRDADAELTRREMLLGARRAIIKAENLVGELNKDMAAFVGTKQGKSMAFPGDLHALDQLDLQPPARIQPRADADLGDIRELLVRMAQRDLGTATEGALPLNAQEAQLGQALAAIARMEKRQKAQDMELAALRKVAKTAKAN
jgi:hypothetical protein